MKLGRDARKRMNAGGRGALAPMSWRCEGVKEKALSSGRTIAPNLVADNSLLVAPFFLSSRRLSGKLVASMENGCRFRCQNLVSMMDYDGTISSSQCIHRRICG